MRPRIIRIIVVPKASGWSRYVFALFLVLCFGIEVVWATPQDHFVTTWKTDNPGSSSTTSITVPMVGGPYDVDWDNDGIFDQFGLFGSVTHDYEVAGINTIRIKGSFDTILFSTGVDKQKIISLDQWGTQLWTTMQGAFWGTTNLFFTAVDTPDFSAVTDMSNMFEGAVNANPNTSNWNTQAVKSMAGMFSGAISANPDTSKWNTAEVENMSWMFSHASSAIPDTSNWDTSSVKNMMAMFQSASVANPNTSSWNTAAVTIMSWMFTHARSANPDTSNWDTAAVWGVSYMFLNAVSANPDITGWNTAGIGNMDHMFNNAISFDRDIGSWDVSALVSAIGMFDNVTLSMQNYESLLIGWNMQTLRFSTEFNGGDSIYCSAAAAAARANMVSTNNWTITDGGHACPPTNPVTAPDLTPTSDTGVEFGGGNSTYCSPQAAAARAQLIAANSWVITDGGKKCLPEGACNLVMVASVIEDYDATHEACELLSIDPEFTVANGANVTLASGWAVDIQQGFTVEKGSTLDIKTCGLSLCEVNTSPMPYGCHSCVDQICDIDPSCCGVSFNQACLDKVSTVCDLTCD